MCCFLGRIWQIMLSMCAHMSALTHRHTQREKGEALRIQGKIHHPWKSLGRRGKCPKETQSNEVMKSWEMLVLLYYSVLKRACEPVL